MPIFSMLGGAIAQGGANAAGRAAGQAGNDAYERALEQRKSNQSIAAPYTASGWAATNALLRAYGLGHLTPPDERVGYDTYGFTRLDQSTQDADRRGALNEFQASPGYQFRVDEGTRALERGAASKGMLLSGAQQKGVTDYAQGRASDEWGNYTNALRAMSGQGATSAAALNNADTSTMSAGNALNFQGDMGQASQYANGANALASGIGKGIQNLTALASFGSPKLSAL